MSILKRLRQMRNMSRKNVADMLGVNPESIARYERGERELRLSHAELLAKLYEVPIEELFSRRDKEGTGCRNREEMKMKLSNNIQIGARHCVKFTPEGETHSSAFVFNFGIGGEVEPDDLANLGEMIGKEVDELNRKIQKFIDAGVPEQMKAINEIMENTAETIVN